MLATLIKWIGIEHWDGSLLCVDCTACSSWRRELYTGTVFTCGCCKRVVK